MHRPLAGGYPHILTERERELKPRLFPSVFRAAHRLDSMREAAGLSE